MVQKKIRVIILCFFLLSLKVFAENTSSLAEMKAEDELSSRIENLVTNFTGKCIVSVDLDLKFNLFESNSTAFKYDPSMSLPGLPVGKTENQITSTELGDLIPTEILRKKIIVKVPVKTTPKVIKFLYTEIRSMVSINEDNGDILSITKEHMLSEGSNKMLTYFVLTSLVVVFFLMLLLNNIKSGMRILAKSMRKIKISNLESLSNLKMSDIVKVPNNENSPLKMQNEPLKIRVMKDEEDSLPTRFDFLDDLSDENLSEVLNGESPEDIAFVLSQISPEKAGSYFKFNPSTSNVIIDAILADHIKLRLDLKILVVNLYNKYLEVMEKDTVQLEGVSLLAKIINHSSYDVSSNLLETIKKIDVRKAEEVSGKIFLLEDILLLSNLQIEQITSEFTHLELVRFLTCTDPKIRTKFYSQLSDRAIMIIKEDMDILGELKQKEMNNILDYSLNKIREILNYNE